MGEKRKYMRFDVLLEAVCYTGKALKKLKVNNFCKEGIGILSASPFSQGKALEIEMMIPGDNVPIVVEGEIAWTSAAVSDNMQYQGGVKFKKISNEDKSRVLEYIYKNWIKNEGPEKNNE
ncbi:MAG: PilZ domain-containing protein [Candidatus Omnitrophota bacterium]